LSAVQAIAAVVSAFVAFWVAMIALAALGVALWQGFVVWKHHRVMVRPILDFRYLIDLAEPRIGIVLESCGLGPAIVKSVTVSLDREEVEATFDRLWPEVLHLIGVADPYGSGFAWTAFSPIGKSMLVGCREGLLLLNTNRLTSSNARLFNDLIPRLEIAVHYEDGYGNKFSKTLKDSPENVFGTIIDQLRAAGK
jgi:hypothetical protein